MTALESEIRANFARFCNDWKDSVDASISDTGKNDEPFFESHSKLTTLQAWRVSLLENLLPERSYFFFLEAQNDGLISHIHARCGAWRSALKSLRSMMENSLLCLYYKDHPVELELWEAGKFKTTFASLQDYFGKHPLVENIPADINGLGLINQEYGKLSKAVHASSREFRMTEDGKAIALWHSDKAHIGKWASHEGKTLQALNLLFLCMFRDKLAGTQQMNLRKSLAFVIPQAKDAAIASELGVRLKR